MKIFEVVVMWLACLAFTAAVLAGLVVSVALFGDGALGACLAIAWAITVFFAFIGLLLWWMEREF